MPLEESYREIQLTRGQVTRVSAHRYEYAMRLRWYAVWFPLAGKFYAAAKMRTADGKRQVVYLHRYMLGLEKGDKREGDHINQDTLNNTDENLRICNRAEQVRNQRMKKPNRSGYKGVWKLKRGMKWRSKVVLNRKVVWWADFYDPAEAHAAYCEKIKEFHGQFARTR